MNSRELTRAERAGIRKLVDYCANHDREQGCLPLECKCYMLGRWWTGAYCRYFEKAVLPLDPLLEATLLGNAITSTRPCVSCGRRTRVTGNRAKYCAACAGTARRRRQREYMRKKRARC